MLRVLHWTSHHNLTCCCTYLTRYSSNLTRYPSGLTRYRSALTRYRSGLTMRHRTLRPRRGNPASLFRSLHLRAA